MTLSDIKAGDVLWAWWDGPQQEGAILYRRVLKVNRTTVTVEDKNGDQRREPASAFDGKVLPHEWSPWNPEGK